MDDNIKYGQMDFNLPHDVVALPSKGLFYPSKKSSLKVGYLTAQDENMLLSAGYQGNIIEQLLKTKVYEPGFDTSTLLEGDIEAILIFLRNTSFGPEYEVELTDPKTNKKFTKQILLDELDFYQPKHTPNSEGLFEFNLPKSGINVKCKLLNSGDINALNKIKNEYPENVIAPVVTMRLQKQIVSVDDNTDTEHIAKVIQTLPIMDSKFIRNTLRECEPRIDLTRFVTAPSGEKVEVNITFGAEFFRPFF